eukprot:351042-Chlamydomonas_euryale.AAC.2
MWALSLNLQHQTEFVRAQRFTADPAVLCSRSRILGAPPPCPVGSHVVPPRSAPSRSSWMTPSAGPSHAERRRHVAVDRCIVPPLRLAVAEASISLDLESAQHQHGVASPATGRPAHLHHGHHALRRLLQEPHVLRAVAKLDALRVVGQRADQRAAAPRARFPAAVGVLHRQLQPHLVWRRAGALRGVHACVVHVRRKPERAWHARHAAALLHLEAQLLACARVSCGLLHRCVPALRGGDGLAERRVGPFVLHVRVHRQRRAYGLQRRRGIALRQHRLLEATHGAQIHVPFGVQLQYAAITQPHAAALLRLVERLVRSHRRVAIALALVGRLRGSGQLDGGCGSRGLGLWVRPRKVDLDARRVDLGPVEDLPVEEALLERQHIGHAVHGGQPGARHGLDRDRVSVGQLHAVGLHNHVDVHGQRRRVKVLLHKRGGQVYNLVQTNVHLALVATELGGRGCAGG